MLTRIFTPESCAHCRLCCNFHRRTAWETPALEPEAVQRLRARNIPLTKHANGADTIALPFQTNDPEEVALCPLLDTTKGCTLPRGERPFECRIWPLRLMHDANGTLLIGCYESCPALTPPVQKNCTPSPQASSCRACSTSPGKTRPPSAPWTPPTALSGKSKPTNKTVWPETSIIPLRAACACGINIHGCRARDAWSYKPGLL